MHSPHSHNAMCGALVDENSIKPTWGARECWSSCLGNNIHSDFIICICAVQNLAMLQVESKLKSKGIFSTTVQWWMFLICAGSIL